tara:strand:+ start:28 stop:276 length:249 start_codon:yes stop_codon:yes gene_type:complete
MTNIKNLKTVVDNRWKEELMEGLEEVKTAVEEADTADSMIVMVKLNGNYVRFSSTITDTMSLIAQLELLKHDVLRRMKKEEE